MAYARQVAFVVQREHVESATWLAQQAPLFGIAIINPGTVTAPLVLNLKNAMRPPRLILLYTNILDATSLVYGSAHHLRRRPIETEGLVAGWKSYDAPTGGDDYPGFVLRPNMAARLAEVDLLRVRELMVGGVYVDQCFPRYPDWVRAGITAAKGGDVAASAFAASAAEDFIEARMLYTRTLKAAGSYTLIGNSRTRTFDPSLNGAALESVPDSLTGLEAFLRYPAGPNIIWDNSPTPIVDYLSQYEFVHVGIFIPPP
jgi:hypothetical protein